MTTTTTRRQQRRHDDDDDDDTTTTTTTTTATTTTTTATTTMITTTTRRQRRQQRQRRQRRQRRRRQQRQRLQRRCRYYLSLFMYPFARWRFRVYFVSRCCNFVTLGQITEIKLIDCELRPFSTMLQDFCSLTLKLTLIYKNGSRTPVALCYYETTACAV